MPTPPKAQVEVIGGISMVDGGDVAFGSTTDPAASASVDEDTTARTAIGLWKGIKNVLIDLKGLLSGGLPAALAAGGGLKVEGVAGGVAQPVSVSLPTAGHTGQETVDSHGTAQPIGSSQALTSGVRVKALSGNAGDVYVGFSNVSSANGFPLDAGEEVFIEIDNVAKVYIDSEQNDDGVAWIGT